jgi:uncharacterized protein YukE
MLAVLALLFGLFSNTYTVHFEGTAAVKEGMPLLYKGVEIGVVTEAGVGADLKPFAAVKVKRKFRDLVREGCAISLDKSAGVLELTGVDRDRPVLPDGSRVPGLAGPIDYLKLGVDKVREKVRDLQLRQEYDRLLDEMDRAWRKGKEKFQEEWPKFKQRFRELKEKAGADLSDEFDRAEEAWKGKAEQE